MPWACRACASRRRGVRCARGRSSTGARLLRVVQRRHSARVRYQARGLEELAGSRAFREALTAPGTAEVARARMDALLRTWADEAAAFQRATRPYWLYPP